MCLNSSATKCISADTVVFQGALCQLWPLMARRGHLHQEVLVDLLPTKALKSQTKAKLCRSSI